MSYLDLSTEDLKKELSKLKSEMEVTDSGIVGIDAAKEFFGKFKTLSEADAEWK